MTEQVLNRGVEAVKWALEYTDDVEFSAEDAVRSDREFLKKVFGEVAKAGADTFVAGSAIFNSKILQKLLEIQLLQQNFL